MGQVEIVIRGPAGSGKSTLAVMLMHMCEAYGIEAALVGDPHERPRDLAMLVPPDTAFACIARERLELPIKIRMEQTSRTERTDG
jgi:hypothetical protein